jgi:hypothetical protein
MYVLTQHNQAPVVVKTHIAPAALQRILATLATVEK